MNKIALGIGLVLFTIILGIAVYYINSNGENTIIDPMEDPTEEPIDTSDVDVNSDSSDLKNPTDINDITNNNVIKNLPKVPYGKVGIESPSTFINQEKTPTATEEYHTNIVLPIINDLNIHLSNFVEFEQLQDMLYHLYTTEYNFIKNTIGNTISPDSLYVLCNKLNHLPNNYIPENLAIPNIKSTAAGEVDKRYVREIMAIALEGLFAAAAEENLDLFCASGYRSYDTQVSVYNYHVDTKGLEAADKVSARPGHSEHQTGLAMDVTCAAINYKLEEILGELDEGIFIAQHAHEYGLIIRYPKDKVNITGYNYEPWHLRYVGIELATFLYENQLTLEELYMMVQEEMFLY